MDEARRFVLQAIWLQRVVYPPQPGNLRTYLEWALEIASSGDPLPPVGFVADVGMAAFGMDRGEKRARAEATNLPGLPPILARTYDDHVLGKIYADWTFERACDDHDIALLTVQVNPSFVTMHNHPRFQAIVKRVVG